MTDDWKLIAIAWAFVLIALVVGYFTDPIPCAHPAQTGCGYDSGHVGFVMLFSVAALTMHWWWRNGYSQSGTP